MSKPMRFALIMDMVLGWRTNYLNWQRHFPQDLNVEPTWVNLSSDKPLWIDRVGGIPNRIKKRLRGYLMLQEGLRQGPYDATYFVTSSALSSLPRYMRAHPSFLYIDATPKQLYSFGDFYGWHPSKFAALEEFKHKQRTAGFQNARAVFSMSKWAGDSAVADYGAAPENIHVLPGGVDLTQWHPGDRAQRPAKDTCNLLFVGGDFERKGGKLLLQWAQQTQSTHWMLHLVTPQLVQTTDPRIHVYNDLTSNDPRLVQLYREADVFVLPTQADCSPWAGIEALASGLPLVIGDTGGTGEIVRSGETGFLIKPSEPGSLEASLSALIADPRLRQRMGQAARADAECRFDATKLVRQAVQLMKDSI